MATSVEWVPARNVLRLWLREVPLAAPRPARATLDVGEQGVLIGLELPADAALGPGRRDAAGEPCYVTVAEPSGSQWRSVEVAVEVLAGPDGEAAAVDVPRRGDGYEITYPSGNR